jgi:hypothetical protein
MALAAEQRVQPPVAEPATLLGQGLQLLCEDRADRPSGSRDENKAAQV